MSRNYWLIPFALVCIVGCNNTPPKPAGGSAEKPKVEAALAYTDLLEIEYAKLQIKTQAAKVEEVHERLTLTGWVMAKPGNEVTLTAPAAGYVQIGNSGKFPFAGDSVGKPQELMVLKPVLSPAEKIQVNALKRSIEGDRKKAKSTLETAQKDYERTLKLHKDKLKSDQELEQALNAKKHAEEELSGAEDKLKLFDMPNISIATPLVGMVLQVHAAPGQYVAAAAPLVTVIDMKTIWIRVPVPEVDLPVVDRDASVEVVWKNANLERPMARPTGRIAQVDPVKHTADLWYELGASRATEHLLKDQMVTVHMKVKAKKDKASVVPYSAIIFDAHGHTWIYVEQKEKKDGKHLFERRRVEMAAAHNGGIVVTPTLAEGDLVVTNGAAVLFSREFFKTPERNTEAK